MKVFSLFFIGILLFLAACQPGGNNAATATAAALDNQDLVATMVAQTLTAIQPTASVTPIPATAVPSFVTCRGDITGVQITMPNDSWTCEVVPGILNGVPYDEAFHINSPLFTIMISTLGRGPYCGDGPNQTGCEVTEIYKNDHLWLATYKVNGEIKEIWGVSDHKLFIHEGENYIWVSVKYEGMETRELTVAEKQDLFKVMDSITFTK